jgi:DNA-directed RNA polymerase
MDFRGRAYPIPPHFNHISGDLCRGLLKFERKKRLGKAGFDWLKIHIANLAGVDKVSLEERREFVAKNLQNILSSAREPMQYEWWRNHDYPFQLLAACIEFSEAYSIPDPTEYESNLPIHQDGSCNGLQHYAALGGDIVGARAVNLDVSDKPGDVYKDVSIRVQEYVDRDANEGKTEAILMKSRITRKLVKQTVMTNTYGVTLIGAKEQVFDRLVEAQANESGDILTKSQIIQCSKYISKLIFEAMEDMFQKARLLQNWLTISARVISSSVSSHVVTEQQIEDCEFLESIGALRPVGHSKVNLTSYYEKLFGVSTDSVDQVESEAQLENRKITAAKSEYRVNSVSWTTPIGFPVVQPYDNRPTIRVKTPLQVFNIVETEGKYPVNAKKQSTAFPPNFIHSLDATHMMLSALACHSQGIEFAAVHDSYWTHGCDVNQMGAILREQFVLLHQKDLMKSLESEFYQKYGKMKTPILVELDNHQLEKYKEYLAKTKRKPTRKILVYQNFTLPPLPSKGSFDINSVKHSTYFFH